MNRFRWMFIGAVLACLASMTSCNMLGKMETREISDYLESRYGSQDFEIEKEETDGASSYRVTPTGYPEVTFTVEEGEIEESMDWKYHDDYASQMLYGGAERLGLSYEKGAEGYDIFILYQDYNSLDSLAEKVEKLVTDCMESKAFEKMRNTCLMVIKPEAETNPDFPGYQVRIDTRYTYPVDKRFGVMASQLSPGQLKEDLRLCHIYNTYNYTIARDASLFSAADVERYKAMCTGAMGTGDDGSIAVYDMVDQDEQKLNFGGAYQILSAEGLVTETAEDSFTASGNGMTLKFSREFDEGRPSVSYEILSGGEEFEEREREGDSHHAVAALTGKTINFSTPEKKEAAKEEERLERLPEIQKAFENAGTQDQTGTVGAIEVTLLDVELYEQLKGGYSSFVQSDEENIWTRIRLRLKNTGNMDVRIFSSFVISGSDDQFFGLVADREANLYRPTEIIGLGLEDIYSKTLPAGETIEGDVYFELPRDLVSKADSLVLYYFCGTDTASILLPAK
ncbi:DUF4352 domain-containing protein [Lachnospiraceae bacterium 62-35]